MNTELGEKIMFMSSSVELSIVNSLKAPIERQLSVFNDQQPVTITRDRVWGASA